MTTGQRIVNWGRHTEEEDEKKNTYYDSLSLCFTFVFFSEKKKQILVFPGSINLRQKKSYGRKSERS